MFSESVVCHANGIIVRWGMEEERVIGNHREITWKSRQTVSRTTRRVGSGMFGRPFGTDRVFHFEFRESTSLIGKPNSQIIVYTSRHRCSIENLNVLF
ncbi:hypothetical protein GWI33_009038 [Rhynchophorus ferrugineus]|uniref:Uncharacterized protein n=1 Tax=Rhynchophorus ferrugineus TaxID=354439 RepID=A0A834MDR7_RHYFE|nr:hypothetical protein GWI33_009038 [Rhynchophorus ferrugineus]